MYVDQTTRKGSRNRPRPAAEALREWRESGPTAGGSPGPEVKRIVKRRRIFSRPGRTPRPGFEKDFLYHLISPIPWKYIPISDSKLDEYPWCIKTPFIDYSFYMDPKLDESWGFISMGFHGNLVDGLSWLMDLDFEQKNVDGSNTSLPVF